MTRPIDLMPRTCREVLGRRLLIRRWGLAYALVTTVLFASSWTLVAQNRVLARRKVALAEQVHENWNRSEKVSGLLVEIAAVEQSVTRYNRLAWPVHATDVVNAIAACLPVGPVSLTELSITPREDRASKAGKGSAPLAAGASAAEGPRTFMIVEIEGLATSDAPVASLVSGLEANPLFSRVSLDFSRANRIGEQDTRNFRVTGEIDLSSRYSFVEASVPADMEGAQP